MDITAVDSCKREKEENSTEDKFIEDKVTEETADRVTANGCGEDVPKSHARNDGIPVSKIRNANSRTIFGNATLACQFLRGYTGFPFFSDIKPEDIEDVTEHYRAFLGVEFEADTVKKVSVRLEGREQEVYVISLIEHKSNVDYDIAMQLLRYMTVIWYDYKKSRNSVQENASSRKSFRYPLIIPIVYYEGSEKWTADMRLSDRIQCSELALAYVPDFTYRVVSLHDYSNRELERHKDEMSLLMMFNRVQSAMDYAEFMSTSGEFIDRIYQNMPEDIKDIYKDVIWSLLIKMNVPADKAQKMMKQLEESSMGVLFENMKFDIQQEWQKTREAEQQAREAEQQAREAEQQAQEAEQRAREAEQQAQEAEQQAREAEQQTREAKQQAREAEQQTREAEQQAQEAKQQAREAEQKAQNYLLAAAAALRKRCLSREQIIKELQELCGITEDEAARTADRLP